jgi:hypothetical protein
MNKQFFSIVAQIVDNQNKCSYKRKVITKECSDLSFKNICAEITLKV